MASTTWAPEEPGRRIGFATLMGVIGLGHFTSHALQFVLPALLPLTATRFGIGLADAALMISAFYLASACSQAVAGFVVDRFGAPRVLATGIALLALSFAAMSVAPYWAMMPLAALAGLGNSVFHPADFAILGARVEKARMGTAFALHGLTGTLGYALAAPCALFIATRGSWSTALMTAAALAAVALVLVIAHARHLTVPRTVHEPGGGSQGGVAVLMTAPVLSCFVFFVLSALPAVGITGSLPSVLNGLFDTPLEVVALAIAADLAGSGIGTLVGGRLADRGLRPERIVVGGLSAAAALVLLVGFVPLGAAGLIAVLGLAGFAAGLTGPSRDLLIQAGASTSTSGRVFGFVYSGYDLGSAAVPLLLAGLIDADLLVLVVPAVAAGYVAMIVAGLAASWRPRHRAAA